MFQVFENQLKEAENYFEKQKKGEHVKSEFIS